jgi:hypothetical protein
LVACDLGYLEKVGAAHRFASDRELLFAGFANGPWSPDRSSKFRVLGRLENETVALLGSILETANVAEPFSRAAASSLRGRARLLAGRRWIEVIEIFAGELAERVAQIEQLARLAPACEAPALARVTAHHIALQMFVRLELAGRGRESILPAMALIPYEPLPIAAAAG